MSRLDLNCLDPARGRDPRPFPRGLEGRGV